GGGAPRCTHALPGLRPGRRPARFRPHQRRGRPPGRHRGRRRRHALAAARPAPRRTRPPRDRRPRSRPRDGDRPGAHRRTGGDMSMELLLALPVMLPLGGAAVSLLLRHHARIQMWLSILTLVSILLVALAMGWYVTQESVLVLQIGNWTPQLGIVLVADRLTALM